MTAAAEESGTPSPPGRPGIPDFEQDEKAIAKYEDAKRRYVRLMLASSDSGVRRWFENRRIALRNMLRKLAQAQVENGRAAQKTTAAYARRLPHRVRRSGVTPPNIPETFVSLGVSAQLYFSASSATKMYDAVVGAIKTGREELAKLDAEYIRILEEKRAQIREEVEQDPWLNTFHSRAEIRAIWDRVRRIREERERYAKRLEEGRVSDEEQRDRAMAEARAPYATLPLRGAYIARVRRFGKLSYAELREPERGLTYLAYDARLDKLRNAVFDLTVTDGSLTKSVRRGADGRPLRVAEYIIATWRDKLQAEQLAAEHKAALGTEMRLPATPPRGAEDEAIRDALASLATISNLPSAEGERESGTRGPRPRRQPA